MLELNEVRCYEAESLAATGSQTQNTSGLSRQCSATELWQPDNHLPPQSSVCTAQVVLNASVVHLAATKNSLGVNQKILSIRKEPILSGFSHSNAQSILPHFTS